MTCLTPLAQRLLSVCRILWDVGDEVKSLRGIHQTLVDLQGNRVLSLSSFLNSTCLAVLCVVSRLFLVFDVCNTLLSHFAHFQFFAHSSGRPVLFSASLQLVRSIMMISHGLRVSAIAHAQGFSLWMQFSTVQATPLRVPSIQHLWDVFIDQQILLACTSDPLVRKFPFAK